jgi:hypothetical protein
VKADKYAVNSFHSAENLYEYMVSWAHHEQKPSKKPLQVANVVTVSYEHARALALRQQRRLSPASQNVNLVRRTLLGELTLCSPVRQLAHASTDREGLLIREFRRK